MARSSWNPSTPDVVGVEFLGIGITSNIIQTTSTMRALRFRPQRTGEVDQVALYCGAGTNNPVLPAAHFSGHRMPFIVELIPASGFDPGGLHTITTYLSAITSSAGVVDEVGTTPEGNELQAPNDGLHLFQSGATPATATVHMLSANTFPTNRQVISIAIESGSFRAMNVRRIDQNGSFTWTRLLQGPVTWHMGEAYLESGDPTNWRLWSPTDVQQFNSGVGNRRLRYNALNTQSNTLDVLRIHVDHIPERRAGVAVIEPLGTYQWVTGDLHIPNVTGAPALVTAGQEYIVLVRQPNGASDYGTSGALDWRGLKDKRPTNTFQHYTHLDWDNYDVTLWEAGVPRALGTLLDGLPSLRLLNDGGQTVDSQPYSGSTSGALPAKVDGASWMRPRQQITIPAGTTEYSKARVIMSVFDTPTTPLDLKYVNLELVSDTSAETLIAGPFQITRAMVDTSPNTGEDLFGDDYKEVTVEFGSGIDLPTGALRARFTLPTEYGEPGRTGVGWRIGALVAEVTPGTGDETAPGAATGHAFIPPTNGFLPLHDTSVRRADLLVSLLSQAPEITGTAVTGLVQHVTGGPCDPCEPGHSGPCTVTEIPYHRVCWSPTSLTQEDFGYYEVQRREMTMTGHMGEEAVWETVAIIAPTGTPVTGAPVVAATCWDDWSHVYDSEVCYRVRQQRTDGTLSDFVEEVCITTPSPNGGDIVITAPDDPNFNVAFPEAHGARLPIERDWTILDAQQHVIRAVYGRDKHIAFRPLERLGLQFTRRLLISALCTPVTPCLSVIDGIHEICQAPVSGLVVRDRCGNRWYATVNVPSVTQIHDPSLGDIWLATLEVTELATPIISAETVL